MSVLLVFFFFNDTATTEIYTLSLHDALPICVMGIMRQAEEVVRQLFAHYRKNPDAMPAEWSQALGPDEAACARHVADFIADRKSTRLNSSHSQISYAVFCLKKKSNKLILIYH